MKSMNPFLIRLDWIMFAYPSVSALSWCQEAAPVFNKAFVDQIVICFFVGQSSDGGCIEAVDDRPGTGQKERGMGGDNELGLPPIANICQDLQKIELAAGG